MERTFENKIVPKDIEATNEDVRKYHEFVKNRLLQRFDEANIKYRVYDYSINGIIV